MFFDGYRVARIKGAQDPIHNGRGRDSDRDIQGEIIGLQLSNPIISILKERL